MWRDSRIFQLLLLVALSASSPSLAARPDFDCRSGCSLDSTVMGQPVCGTDGLTYINACLAVCQGVAISHTGTCEIIDEGVTQVGNSYYFSDSKEVVSETTMQRFASENFRLTAVRRNSEEPDESYILDTVLDQNSPLPPPPNTNNKNRQRQVRVTRDGLEYMAPIVASSSSSSIPRQTSPSYGAVGDDSRRRQLRRRRLGQNQRRAVILGGTDERDIVEDTTVFPYRIIAEADFSWGSGGCSLTLISRTSALTAGHCVYSYTRQAPTGMNAIAPGRRDDPDNYGATIEPFGVWEVDYYTTMEQYSVFGWRSYDSAVVTYLPRAASDFTVELVDGGSLAACGDEIYPGDVVGFAGIAEPNIDDTSDAIVDSRLQQMMVTGYPFDAPNGQMRSSGVCDPPFSNHSHYLLHFCDTAAGNSGSSVMTADEYLVMGNHAHGYYEPGSSRTIFNGAPMLTNEIYESVYAWAGLDGDNQGVCGAPLAPREYPTTSPSVVPSAAPVGTVTAVDQPTGSPISAPSAVPTVPPTSAPTASPTSYPTASPTVYGTLPACPCNQSQHWKKLMCWIVHHEDCLDIPQELLEMMARLRRRDNEDDEEELLDENGDQ